MRNRQTPGLAAARVTRSRASLLRTTAIQLASVLVFASPVFVSPVFVGHALAQPAPGARPMGGAVVGGSASIGQTATTTTIAQSSQRAAIDWRSFDVGRDQTVQFRQPGSSAVVLNRVTGPDPSAIAGRIEANGQVIITNRSGVVFHQGAQVETAGLVVSAAGIATPNFMAGRMVFDQAPNPNAEVSNAGRITVRQAGLAALVAPRVANSGVIDAKMGRVALAGAETHTVDLYGDGLLSIDVTRQVRQAPRGADGKPVVALVTNTGIIMANGGTVQLTAAAADGIVQDLVRAGGRVQAGTAGGRAGTIEIAGVGGSVRIEGRVAADGRGAGDIGGSVVARATEGVTVAAGSRISANGSAGGGTIAIGTTAARAAGGVGIAAPMAARATVQAGARISADARDRGNGGKVTVVAAGTTRVDGAISARGGRSGGDGGTVELSGAGLAVAGKVDTGAPAGRAGKILLDPTDVTISNHGGAGTVVTPASLQAMVGDVTVLASNSIAVSSSVTLAQPNQSLTLTAGVRLGIDLGVTLDVTGGLTLGSGIGGIGLLGGAVARGAQGVIFNTTGPVTQGALSTVNTGLLTGLVGSAALTSLSNQIANVGSGSQGLTASAGDISLVSAIPLTVSSNAVVAGLIVPNGRTVSVTTDRLTLAGASVPQVISAPGGTIAIQPFTAGTPMEVTSAAASAGALSIAAASLNRLAAPTLSLGSASAGLLTLQPAAASIDFGAAGITTLQVASGTGIVQNGAIGVTNLSGSAPAITLGNVSNFIPHLGPLTAAGNIFFHSGSTLAVDGPVAGANVALSSGGAISPSMTLNANVTGATVSLDTFNGASLASSGALLQTAGILTATSLTGQSFSATLNQANQVTGLGDFHTASGFALTTATPLQLTGALLNDAGTVRLNASGAITQTGGSLVTPNLGGTAASAAFGSVNNTVGNLLDFATSLGDLALTTKPVPARGPTVPLQLVTSLSVPAGRTIAITADGVAFTPGVTVSAPGGTVAFAPLTAARPVEMVGSVASATAGSLSVPQSGIATIQTGTLQLGSAAAGPITIGKAGEAIDLTGHATTLSLISSGAIGEGAGATITVPTLTATAASAALGGGNAIGSLGNATTVSGFQLTNGQALGVTGSVTDGVSVRLDVAGNLALSGVLTAPTVTLNATGALSQPAGSINAGLLQGTTGSANLSGLNQIDRLGPFLTTGDFALRDGRTLSTVGLVDPGNVTLTVAGDLAVNSAVIGATVNLQVTGNVTEGAGGGIFATTLRGTAATVRLNGTNQIATLADFTSTGGFVLANAAALGVTGPLSDGVSIGLTSSGPLTVSGNIAAPTVSLTALRAVRPAAPGGITQTAGIITAGSGLVLQAADAVAQTGGAIVAGQVSGFSGATTSLGQAANQIGTLASYSSVGGFSLTDGQALAQIGALADTASIGLTVTGGLSLGGTVSAPAVNLAATGAVAQPGGAIAATTLTGTTGGATLNQAANAIANLGAFTGGGAVSISDGTPLNVAGAASVAAGGTLSLSSNSIQFSPGGSLAAPGGTVALAPLTPGSAFALGSLLPAGSAPAVTANTLQIGNAAAGSIGISGGFNLANVNTLSLVSAGAVTEAAGATITVSRLTASGTTVRLDGPNAIGSLGNVTASGPLTLVTSGTLQLLGAVSATGPIALAADGLALAGGAVPASVSTPGLLTLVTTGAISEPNGAILAGSLTGSASNATLGGNNRIATLAGFATNGAAGGNLVLNDQGNLSVTAPVQAAGTATLLATGVLDLSANISAGTLTLVAPTVTQSAGTISAGTLNASVVNATLTSSSVDTLGSVQANGTFRQIDNIGLTLTGPVNAATLDLTANGLTFAGPVAAAALVATSGAGIAQKSGTVQAGTLAGNAAGAVDLGGAGAIANIGTLIGFTAGGTLSLANGTPLTVTGILQAPQIQLTAPTAMTLQGGSFIADNVSVNLGGLGGRLIQTGRTTFAPRAAATANVLFGALGGTISLQNLVAPTGALTLSLGSGTATGNLVASDLLVRGTGGSANLFGTVRALGGFDAAYVSRISPNFDKGYQINNCAIASVSCVPIVPRVTVRLVEPGTIRPDIILVESYLRPDLFTADLITLDIIRNTSDPDFPLPNISDRDY